IIMALVGIKFLRVAAIHTPTSVATALGLIAAAAIGEIAVDVGMISPEGVLYVSISSIGTYATASSHLRHESQLVNILLVLAAALFGVTGFLIGFVIFMLFLISLKTLETPYLWPFIPFNAIAMLHMMLRIPVPFSNTRPSIVNPKNDYRQPVK